ncbi:rRNA cytosine-C5-methyltransferase [Parabacteroides gordonii]|jgi:16S rRNA C967 or C1407 C5-methylase (RsmB/RsmF family)/NOL1/NOP2/fmu family ribosome biogenesis protein|uniref:methyltransferase RsmF C-terminal domain-like protein n=1 Tax=Parabacteroides gordonii TaxID=574930 RepID=UPI0024202380|nr:rRNA cytosine-C5-methyltransferase [Parabacteroides gordonii]
MALPIDFITRTRALLGDEYEKLEAALQADVPVSIRINQEKGTKAPETSPVGWSKTGYYLPERLSFTFDPLFHAGAYYVQEASSMFLEQAIRNFVTEPVRCLDLCAAPGGKSTHLLSTLPEGSLLVSNEVIRSRSNILAENITKWGNPNNIVINNDPEEIGRLTHLFDVIVTDVPCSGEGMFRKDTDSTGEWSVANVNLCAARQRRIIHDIWDALKPGGLLIYSTCTYNTEEDEDNIHYIIEELGAEALTIPLKEEWQITGALRHDHPVYRFFPHKTKGEGFFLAALRKAPGETEEIRPRNKSKKERGKAAPVLPSVVNDWIEEAGKFRFELINDTIQAIPSAHQEAWQLIAGQCRIVTAGIRIGEIKGKDILPAHSLAMSTSLNRKAFITVEINWEDAVKYLKKEVLLLPEETKKGYVLVCYNGFPLGFVKHLGNRANNLYPQEWRIRSGYLPDKVILYPEN